MVGRCSKSVVRRLGVFVMALYAGDATAALSPDSKFYSASAMKTAQIEGDQHYEELKRAGVLNIRRGVIIRARAPDGLPLKGEERIVHLIRHGQGFHNLLGDLYRDFGRTVDSTGGDGVGEGNPYTRPEIVDSPLTAVGRDQAKGLRVATRALSGIKLVVVSPLQRAVQTAALAMPHLKHKVPWVGHPAVQETSGKNTCDRRRDRSEIKDDFPWVDWSLLRSEVDDVFDPAQREAWRSVSDRAYDFLLWLRERPEREVAVATHSAWLFTLLNTVVKCDQDRLATWFLTGELRTVILSFEDYILSDMDQQVKDAYGYSYPLPPKDDDGTVLDWATPNPNADLPDL